MDTCGTWTPTSQCKCDVLANYTTWPISRVEKTWTSNFCIPNAGGWPITRPLYIAEDIGFEPIHPFRLPTVQQTVPLPLGLILQLQIKSTMTSIMFPIIRTWTFLILSCIMTGTLTIINPTSFQDSIHYLIIRIKNPTLFSKYLYHNAEKWGPDPQSNKWPLCLQDKSQSHWVISPFACPTLWDRT